MTTIASDRPNLLFRTREADPVRHRRFKHEPPIDSTYTAAIVVHDLELGRSSGCPFSGSGPRLSRDRVKPEPEKRGDASRQDTGGIGWVHDKPPDRSAALGGAVPRCEVHEGADATHRESAWKYQNALIRQAPYRLTKSTLSI